MTTTFVGVTGQPIDVHVGFETTVLGARKRFARQKGCPVERVCLLSHNSTQTLFDGTQLPERVDVIFKGVDEEEQCRAEAALLQAAQYENMH